MGMKHLEDLKTILHSKRANIYYLETCRVLVKDGRVVYLTKGNLCDAYWNIPIANTTVVLLGIGTSITQAAVRLMAAAGVLVGFSGNGGTPLIMGTEIEWMTPQCEYRPTEYVQGWLSFWYDDLKRLQVAKRFQIARIEFLSKVWSKDSDLKKYGFDISIDSVHRVISHFRENIEKCKDTGELLRLEALMTKQLYKIAANNTIKSHFVREREGVDRANQFLDHGNYLAYGLGATTLWVLGIPHGFAVLHGKTRRGALVFDVADLIKDALVLPLSFICATTYKSENDFRDLCLQKFIKHKALDYMFDQVKINSLANHEKENK